jgi:DinB superfamily
MCRFLLAILIAPAFAQDLPIHRTIKGSVAQTLDFVEGDFLAIAEAMPESKYGFIPTAGNFEGVRSFGEQIKHVACTHVAFFKEIEGKTPPDGCEKGGPSKAATKPELIRYLRESFDYGNRVLSTIEDQTMLSRVDGRYAGPNTRLGMTVTAVWHITDHYGQVVSICG